MTWDRDREVYNLQELSRRAIRNWMLEREEDAVHHELLNILDVEPNSLPSPVAAALEDFRSSVPREKFPSLRRHFSATGESGKAEELAMVDALLELFEITTRGGPLE